MALKIKFWRYFFPICALAQFRHFPICAIHAQLRHFLFFKNFISGDKNQPRFLFPRPWFPPLGTVGDLLFYFLKILFHFYFVCAPLLWFFIIKIKSNIFCCSIFYNFINITVLVIQYYPFKFPFTQGGLCSDPNGIWMCPNISRVIP